MNEVLFTVKCVDANKSFDCLTLGQEYRVFKVNNPKSINLINLRGAKQGKITANKEAVYELDGVIGLWDESRFERVST